MKFKAYLKEEEVKSRKGAKVFIMRHGRTVLDDEHVSDGWLDYPLSDEGRRGLVAGLATLKTEPIKKIYAPSLRRTHETAHIVGSGILSRPEVHTDDTPRTWHLGVMMGTKKKQNKPLVKYFMDHPNEKPSQGESMAEFKARFCPWIEKVKQEAVESGQPILCVLSGSNIRELSDQFTGDCHALDLDEGGMIKLEHTGDDWQANVVFGKKDAKDELDS